MTGRIVMVGAGPGDPGLLTVRGLESLRNCDVVLYDRLVSREVLDLIPSHVRRVYVGKSADQSGPEQDRINGLMVKEAKRGLLVVRLKGGDPFLFGRGGEEVEFLRRRGVEFTVVPGISSALAVPAAVGIPLTHRLYSSSVAIATGQEDERKGRSDVRWGSIAHAVDTIVILMGVRRLGYLVREIMGAGLDSRTPAAVIEWGTTRSERVIMASLGRLVSETRRMRISSPAIIVIGDVVRCMKNRGK